MKVLVTGSNGFIGKNLTKTLTQLNKTVETINEGIFDNDDWCDLLVTTLNNIKPTVIFHVGACSDTLETNVNYMMTRNFMSTKILMDWCSNNDIPMIYSSSAANYGDNDTYPSNLYGWSKYVGEQYVISNGGVSLRYFNVYGPGEEDKGRMASIHYQVWKYNNLHPNKEFNLFPKEPKRDFVYIDDIVDANMYSWHNYSKVCGEYYEVGSGEARKFEDILYLFGFPYYYLNEDKIPKGYQFYTCSNKDKWLPNWAPKYNLERGISDYIIKLKKV